MGFFFGENGQLLRRAACSRYPLLWQEMQGISKCLTSKPAITLLSGLSYQGQNRKKTYMHFGSLGGVEMKKLKW